MELTRTPWRRPPRPVANLNPSPATTETKISIQYALGYDHLPEDDIEPVNANGVSDPGSASTQLGQAHFRYAKRALFHERRGLDYP